MPPCGVKVVSFDRPPLHPAAADRTTVCHNFGVMRLTCVLLLLTVALSCGRSSTQMPGSEQSTEATQNACQRPLADYSAGRPDVRLEEHIASLRKDCPAFGAATGSCGRLTFVSHATGFTSATHYFESTGQLVAIHAQSDAVDAPCHGHWRYGVRVDCQQTNVRTICSQGIEPRF